jgi:hypothetical protein
MKVLDISTIQLALAVLMIVLCAVFILLDLYLALGWISPDLSMRIDRRIRKALNKPPVIILDPWYIPKRNFKLFVWIYVSSHMLILGIVYIIVSIG